MRTVVETFLVVTQVDFVRVQTPINLPAWTIGVLIFMYAAFPRLAPAVERDVAAEGARARDFRAVAWDYWMAYCMLVVLAVSAVHQFLFVGLACVSPPGVDRWVVENTDVRYIGWSYGLGYNFAFIQLPVFAMGCIAAREVELAVNARPTTDRSGRVFAPSSNACSCAYLALIIGGTVGTSFLEGAGGWGGASTIA